MIDGPECMDLLSVGQRVAYLRLQHGWNQQTLADRLGKSKSWVEKVERGARGLDRLSVLRKIEDVLEAPDALIIRRRGPGLIAWRHVECGQLTHAQPAAPPDLCEHCGRWDGNWHKAVTAAPSPAANRSHA